MEHRKRYAAAAHFPIISTIVTVAAVASKWTI
uniref:Uncharacterized protein n=1 Tax=Siphoviridae sp. ctuUw41 TaxID=2826503 RepID=A0A8S5MXR7_9CAUD|nr:MAG TPA: hypothetical protein [Siphoviridae sp. ctuUw41]